MSAWIIAIAGRKGGSGKTTTAINLAGALVERDLRVAIVDLDPQASLTRILLAPEQIEGGEGIGSRILAPQKGIEGLARPTALVSGLHVLLGDRSIESAALALADNPTGPFRLRQLLGALHGYDVLLLDTPPVLGFALNSALLAASVALLPTELVQQDLDALADTINVRDELAFLGAARIGAILPNAVRNDGHDRAILDLLRTHYGPLLADPIPLSVHVKYALDSMLPVTQYEPKSAVAAAYRALAARILAEVRDGAPA
jgi:chromosome partitioning protein